jgi:hypothetical protein
MITGVKKIYLSIPFEPIGRADTIKEDGKKPAIDCKEKNPYIGIQKND